METTYATEQGREIIEGIPKYHEYIKKIESLDPFEKAFAYNDYFTNRLSLKHNFAVFPFKGEKWNGSSKNTEIFKNIAISYLWKDQHIYTIDEFFSKKRIEIRDHGEDWDKYGYAQRINVNMYGAFWWLFEGL